MDVERLAGRVVEFDSHQGVGEIEGEDGRRYFFHCARIADGTREIEKGREVSFEVRPGLLGRWEASTIVKR